MPNDKRLKYAIIDDSIKYILRNPSIANILEVYKIIGSCVMPNTAGMESTANITSDNSIVIKHSNRGVIQRFPFSIIVKLPL